MHAGTGPSSHGRTKAAGVEYSIYFTLIFLISLPTALIRMVIPHRGRRAKFFVTEAWAMARDVMPRIFSA